jgi:hypothetical protein
MPSIAALPVIARTRCRVLPRVSRRGRSHRGAFAQSDRRGRDHGALPPCPPELTPAATAAELAGGATTFPRSSRAARDTEDRPRNPRLHQQPKPHLRRMNLPAPAPAAADVPANADPTGSRTSSSSAATRPRRARLRRARLQRRLFQQRQGLRLSMQELRPAPMRTASVSASTTSCR